MVVTKRILIVYNPSSGPWRIKQPWTTLGAALQAAEFQVAYHNLLREKLRDRTDLREFTHIASIGGDGTLHTIVQVLCDASLDIPIAIVPSGTANIVAGSLRVPRSLRAITAALRHGSTLRMDIAVTSDTTCVLTAFAAGYLSTGVTQIPYRLKRWLGFMSYIMSLLRQIRLPEHNFQFTVDGQSYTQSGHSLFVVNAANVFGISSQRDINFQDGLFELVVTHNSSIMTLPRTVFDFYFHTRTPKHFSMYRGSSFEIKLPENIHLQIDGEILPWRPTVSLSVRRQYQQIINT